MPVVKVMKHRQVVIPKELFEKLHLEVGDYLEAHIKNGKLVYVPKSLVDRDIEEGRVYGPFTSVGEWRKSLKKTKL